MILAAAVLAASIGTGVNVEIDLRALFTRGRSETVREVKGLTCGIKTVGYRFIGKPGQSFRYAGDEYQIPDEGAVELIAARFRDTYQIRGKSLPLDVWPQDQFGFREVPLPTE